MAEEEKPEETPKEEEAKSNLAITNDGKFVLTLDLVRMGPAAARGSLLIADDYINAWYANQAKLREKLLAKPNPVNGMKAYVGKLFRGGR